MSFWRDVLRPWLKYLAIVGIVAAVIGLWCWLVLGCDGNETPPQAREYPDDFSIGTHPRTQAGERSFHNGVKLYNLREYEDAEVLLAKYVFEKGRLEARPMAYLLLGEIQREKDDHCGSIPYYEHALKYGSPYVRHHAGVNLVYAALRCDRVDLAEQVSTNLMNDSEARFRKADVGANDDIETARAFVYRRMGHDAANKGWWVTAVDNYHCALELRPDLVDVACDKAWALLRLAETVWRSGLRDRSMRHLVDAKDILYDPRYSRFDDGRCADLRVEIESEITRQYGLTVGRDKARYEDPRHMRILAEITNGGGS